VASVSLVTLDDDGFATMTDRAVADRQIAAIQAAARGAEGGSPGCIFRCRSGNA